ncbi:hypothetical protein ABZ858_00230 [Streptomyces sp. NPDC047017]|uniref:hypothetical protein n=1 Tax=Streptomyces sp. NPDC047017 TaxID=3155024 RepID=UPI0033EE1D2A
MEAAARVAAELTDNAGRHGRPFVDGCVMLRLTVNPETNELLVQVDDADPSFPRFVDVLSNARRVKSGLGVVLSHRARVERHMLLDEDGAVRGKTVQAKILPGLPGTWGGGAA